MPSFDLEFEVYCSCGGGLCNQSDTNKNGHSHYVTVEPCESCIDDAKEEGKETVLNNPDEYDLQEKE